MEFSKIAIDEYFEHEETQENGFSGFFKRVPVFLSGAIEVNAVDIKDNTKFLFIGSDVDVKAFRY